MEKEKIFTLIITLICIPELILLLLYIVKYLAEWNFHDFMEKLDKKLWDLGDYNEDYFSEFEELFNRYSDSTGLMALANIFKSLAVFVPIFILLLFVVLFQINYCCKQKDFLRFILSIIFLIICFGISFVYVAFAFQAKYELNLTDDKIYIFDEQFNKEIKDNLDFMYERRIYMIVCIFLSLFFFLVQIVLIILKEKLLNKGKANINNNFERGIGPGPFEEAENVVKK